MIDASEEVAFERWVEVSAELLGRDGDARDVILDARAIEAPAWDRADALWHTELASDIARGDLARARRYASACREELARRAQLLESKTSRGVDRAEPGEQAGVLEQTLPLLRLDLGRSMPFVQSTTSVDRRSFQKAATLATSGSDGDTIVPELFRLGLPVTPFEPSTTVMESVEAYASFCAEIERAPGDRLLIYARFGIGTGRDAEALHMNWRTRFATDATLNQEWAIAFEARRKLRR